MHLSQNHSINMSVFDPERALAKQFQVIFEQTKVTAKCHLCLRKVAREKVFNHIRYFHKASTDQVNHVKA